METAELINRTTGKGDRRTTAVTLTARAKTLLVRGTPLAMGNNSIMETRLSEAELADLRRLLEKVRHGDPAALPKF